MIRGVNKQIIEVSETNSRYFERALLFVRPEFIAADHDRLCAEAKRYISAMGQPPSIVGRRQRKQFKKKRGQWVIRLAIPFGIGASLVGLILLLLNVL